MANRSKHFFTSVEGVSGRVPPRADQTQKLYGAENLWLRYTYPRAGQTISEQGAQDLVGEILHHKSLDNFPDIHHLRQNFDPNYNVLFDSYVDSNRGGETDDTGNITISPDHLKVGVVTHETSHLAHLLGHQFTYPYAEPGESTQGFDHEWPFAATHLHIVHNILGKEASIPLKNAYRMSNVKFQPKHRVSLE